MPRSVQARFLNLMTAKGAVKFFVKNSTDGYGSPVFSTGAATTYQCHFRYEKRAVWGKDGIVSVNEPVAYLNTTGFIDPRSRFVFPSVGGSTFRIGKVIQAFDNSGAHHIKLELLGG